MGLLYGRGKKQRQVIEWGKNGQLTYGKLVELYGRSQSILELDRLENLGYIAIDETTMNNDELVNSTRIMWLVEDDQAL